MSPTEEPGAAEQYMCDKLLFRVHKKLLSTIIWLDALINGVASWETLYWSAPGKPGACSALEMREGRVNNKEYETEWYTWNQKRPTIGFREGHMCTCGAV